MKMKATSAILGCLLICAAAQAEDDVHPLKNIDFLISRVDESDPFFKTLFSGVRQLKAEGLVDNINIINYEGSAEKEDEQFRTALNHADGIIMDYVDRTQTEAFAKEAAAKNIPLIFVFTKPSPQVLASYPNVFYITQDDLQSGVSQGLLISRYLEKNPQTDKNKDGVISIVSIAGGGYKAPDEVERFAWLFNTIDSYPGSKYRVKELANYPAQYNSQKAYDFIDNLAKQKQLDNVEMITAQSDNMAQAAADALQANGYKIPVVGRGNAASSKPYIQDGRMIGSIQSSPYLVGYYAGMIAYNYANHIDINSNIPYRIYRSSLELPYDIITADNL